MEFLTMTPTTHCDVVKQGKNSVAPLLSHLDSNKQKQLPTPDVSSSIVFRIEYNPGEL